MLSLRLPTSFLLGISLLFLGAESAAQTTPPPASQVYANFFGTWAGSNHYKKDDGWHDSKVNLKISPDKRGMRFDYDYVEDDGKGGHDRYTRFVTLTPSNSQVILQFSGSSKETYVATGLSEFARTGFGTFSFGTSSGTSFIVRPDSKPSASRCIFALEKDDFSYEWQSGDLGKPYKIYALWTLKRVSAPTNPSP